jgi:adenylosuccinate lyase
MTEIVYLFQILQDINSVLIDFCRDMRYYASDGIDVVRYKKKEGEVGSSVMPQKVNPRQFEDAEGNAIIANILTSLIALTSDISRLQRDMSGHAVERNYGLVFGETLIARKNILDAISRTEVNEEHNLEILHQHPEIIGEGVQTILRREGCEKGYEILKALLRGEKENIMQNLQHLYTYL